MDKTEHALNLQRELHALADSGRAEISRRFFKTGPGEYGEGDRFLGLRVPQVRSLARQYRALPIETLRECLQSSWHEERLLALFILVEQYRRGTETSREAIFQTYLASTDRINNWDLVDSSAEHIVGAHIDPERLDILESLAVLIIPVGTPNCHPGHLPLDQKRQLPSDAANREIASSRFT